MSQELDYPPENFPESPGQGTAGRRGLSGRGLIVGGVACRGGAGARTRVLETEARGDGKGLEGKSVNWGEEAGHELLSPSRSCDLFSEE